MSITLYRCPEPECSFTVGQWKPFLKHQRKQHNLRYNKKTDKWTRMKALEL